MEYPAVPRRLARGLDRLAFAPWTTGPLGALAELAAVVAPSECIACRRPDAVMCPACRRAFRTATVRPFEAQAEAEGLPLLDGREPLRVLSAGPYAREVSAAVLAFKDRQRVSLAGVLGPALAGSIRAAVPPGPGPVALVPIPSSRLARARRGYAPVDLLLQWIVHRDLLPPGVVVVHALRVRSRAPWAMGEQKSKGRRARSSTAAQLEIRGGHALQGRRVVLLDDVLTTGSTLARGYRSLRLAGAAVESAAVLAATAAPRRREDAPDRTGEAMKAPEPRPPASVRASTRRPT
ncbi:ComF family protein [Arthrobacter sp. JSM 101049]|uniref:ComF family protein n=1 Tax=Arthrobacter sp. JSM 101049 TaxID=929097 RepID=UPI003569C9E7